MSNLCDCERGDVRYDINKEFIKWVAVWITINLHFRGIRNRVFFFMSTEDEDKNQSTYDNIFKQLEQENNLQLVFHNLDNGVYAADGMGTIVFANDSMAKILGYSSHKDIIGKSIFDVFKNWKFYCENQNPIGIEDLPGRRLFRNLPIENMVIFCRNQDTGQTRWFEIKSSPVFKNGSLSWVLNVIHDLTEQRRIMQEYQAATRRNQRILESITDAFISLDNSWRFTYINKKAESFFGGRRREDLIGKNILDEFPQSRSRPLFQRVLRALENRETLRVEEFIEQSKQWLEITIYPTSDGLAVYLRDITESRQASETNAKLAAIIESSEDAIIGKDLDGTIVSWNKGAERIYGYMAEEVLGKSVAMLMPSNEYEDMNFILNKMRQGELVEHYETIRVRKDGTLMRMSVTVSPIKDKSGNVIGASTISRDITEQKKVADALKANEERFRAMIEHSSDGVVLLNDKGCITYCTEAVKRILGFTETDLIDRNIMELIHPDHLNRIKNLFEEILSTEAHAISSEFRALTKDGNYCWIEGVGNNLLHIPSINAIVANFRDVTQRKKIEQSLLYQYHHDDLTDLPNRTYLNERLNQSLTEADAKREIAALLIVDLDRFKTINESLGHAIGDRLIQEVALRMRSCIGEDYILARLGGDEFGILITNAENEETVAKLCSKILAEFNPAFYLDKHELYISPSIGISLYPYDGKEPSVLFKNAETALYRAKDYGRNTYQFYTTTMNSASYEKLTLESKLRHAIENNEFVLFYQPQIDIQTGKIVGAEELVRWQRPDMTLILPDRFIPLAEANGLIEPIGLWVLKQSLCQAKTWHDKGFDIMVAINLSARQFKQKNFERILINAIEECGVKPSSIELELTESVLAENPENVMNIMNALRDRGVRFCLDDFSTGYSSLRYIKQFPVDMLKIERNFLKGIPLDLQNSAIAKSIITLGQTLGMEVTAEGVESKKQLSFLRENLCNRAQGYLFNGAMPAHSLSEILGEDRYVSVIDSLGKDPKNGF